MKKIPAGYTLRSSHVYDNTTNNPNNPNNPPQMVTAGQTTADEMLFDAFQWMIYQTGDENIDIGSLLLNDTLLNPPTSIYENLSASGISSFAYPNPFEAKIKVGYDLKFSGNVSVEIYNIYGNKVSTLSNKFEIAGANDSEWNGKNDAGGAKVPAGVYFYIIRSGKSTNSGKIVLMPNK